MKKALFLAALAALTFGFTSCEKDTQKPSAPGTEEPGDNPGGGEVDPKPEYRLLEDFENGGMLTWTGSGCAFEIVDNPSSSEANSSSKVGKVTAGGAQWEFTWSTFFGSNDNPEYLDFSKDGYIVKVDVLSPKAGAAVYLKIEGDKVEAIEIPSATTKSGAWETLAFDYEPKAPADGAYRNFVILFDAGAVTTQGEEYFYDNIRLCKE